MRGITVLIVLASLTWSVAAFGGAKEHFINGSEYYEAGQYKEAIEEFEKAYRLDPKPLLLYNIAQAYEKMGKLKKAVDYFNQFIDKDTRKTDTASVKNKIANLEARIQKTGIAVTSNEDGAGVFVDDVQVGVTPISGVIPLEEGMHRIRISKEGFKDFTMNTGISMGYAVPVDAKLEPGQGTPAGAAAPVIAASPKEEAVTAPPEPEATPEETGETTTTAEPSPSEDGKKVKAMDVVPWVVAGVGAATAIVGLGVLGGMAKSNEDHDMAVLADAVGWPGVGLAAIGTVWGIVHVVKKKKESKAAVSVLPALDPSGAGVAATVTF